MLKILLAVFLILAVGLLIAVLFIRKLNRLENRDLTSKHIIVNQGVDVETGQFGRNQNKYFRGMSGEIPDTIYMNQIQREDYVVQNPGTQIIFCNLKSGCTVTTNLTDCLYIGRGTWKEEGFLHISDNRMVSNRHCRILRQNGVIYLEDLQSRNYTYLNGRQIKQRMKLKSGDVIALGPEQFQVKFY